MWYIIEENLWNRPESSFYERAATSIFCIKNDMGDFYKRYSKDHDGKQLTTVKDLTPKMLGVGGVRKLGTKAMETWGGGIIPAGLLQQEQSQTRQQR